ncbi:MAG: tRNA (adenosine(37)-N6)-threonylcarbamoyltransferase complex dimerization subunit type 1 TsaB [Gemmatimonadetes bacterium]|nr:tRNA (adenosine(37)-N6)-threonylcarbamoyltransferase complex dimerization subunit type 1 TsaB [Gemmatimonadota bacterium]
MTLYLALDTVTDSGSVAVGEPGSIASEVLVGARRHAAALVPAVDEALKLAGVSLADVQQIIIADGPGSFTGLRIGFATVQGLVRQRSDVAVMTAPSLMSAAVLASRFVDGPVAALYDALRGEVFAAIYRFHDQTVEMLIPPSLSTLPALRESGIHPVVAVGDGAEVYADAVRAWTGRDPVVPPAGGPRAAGLVELAAVGGALRSVDDVMTWEPDYGRLADAQVRWDRAHGQSLPDSVGDRG